MPKRSGVATLLLREAAGSLLVQLIHHGWSRPKVCTPWTKSPQVLERSGSTGLLLVTSLPNGHTGPVISNSYDPV